jgi:cytochrome c551/c552
MKRLLQVAFATFCLLPGGFAAAWEGPLYPVSAPLSRATRAEVGRLAEERGCTFCHREAPGAAEAEGALPLAPSWREIASRYRGRAGAERELAAVVIEGADPTDLHWTRRLDFAAMRGNAPQVSPAEARALARLILSSR